MTECDGTGKQDCGRRDGAAPSDSERPVTRAATDDRQGLRSCSPFATTSRPNGPLSAMAPITSRCRYARNSFPTWSRGDPGARRTRPIRPQRLGARAPLPHPRPGHRAHDLNGDNGYSDLTVAADANVLVRDAAQVYLIVSLLNPTHAERVNDVELDKFAAH
jgi:hypothetical protein